MWRSFIWPAPVCTGRIVPSASIYVPNWKPSVMCRPDSIKVICHLASGKLADEGQRSAWHVQLELLMNCNPAKWKLQNYEKRTDSSELAKSSNLTGPFKRHVYILKNQKTSWETKLNSLSEIYLWRLAQLFRLPVVSEGRSEEYFPVLNLTLHWQVRSSHLLDLGQDRVHYQTWQIVANYLSCRTSRSGIWKAVLNVDASLMSNWPASSECIFIRSSFELIHKSSHSLMYSSLLQSLHSPQPWQ